MVLGFLDQLNSYENIVNHVKHPVDNIDVRNSRELLSFVDGWKKRCTDRLGVHKQPEGTIF